MELSESSIGQLYRSISQKSDTYGIDRVAIPARADNRAHSPPNMPARTADHHAPTTRPALPDGRRTAITTPFPSAVQRPAPHRPPKPGNPPRTQAAGHPNPTIRPAPRTPQISHHPSEHPRLDGPACPGTCKRFILVLPIDRWVTRDDGRQPSTRSSRRSGRPAHSPRPLGRRDPRP
jgi:hypothetical protein